MTTATAPRPLEEYDRETTVAEYVDHRAAAGSVVWSLLTHDRELAPDLARLVEQPVPEWLEDRGNTWLDVVWAAIHHAGSLGYRLAQTRILEHDATTPIADVAAALAALAGRELVDDVTPDD
jgi:hypothetical protein